MATDEEVANLRLLLGERIPAGGTETDTMFSDQELEVLIDGSPSLEVASYEGWRMKAANFANLVNVTDGAASREFSDLLDNALNMVKLYSRSSSGPTEGRTRIGKIKRGD